MNIEQLREELKIDEGVKYEVYLDHLGLANMWYRSFNKRHKIQSMDFLSVLRYQRKELTNYLKKI